MIHGYAALEPKEKLTEFSYEPKDLGPQDVLIKVTHCGICHSDIHLIDNDWNRSTYPFIPGHEIVGIVESLGKEVVSLKNGDRVGVGWQCGSCLACEACIAGEENHCDRNQATCVGRNGGFADRIMVDSRFAYLIPEKLSSEHAAPLLCAGITVYTPLRRYCLPHMRVGVIGIGGLGHLALQFARAMGCEVTAISTSPDKEQEARNFGASRFIASKDPGQMKSAEKSLDLLISAVTVDLDWSEYFALVRSNGTLVFVGASQGPLEIAPVALVRRSRRIAGSSIGNRHTMAEMLMFAARHGIKPMVEVVPLKDVNAAIGKVRENKARYRMVLKV